MAFRDEQMTDLYDEGHAVFSISKHNNRLCSLKVYLHLVSFTVFWLGEHFQTIFGVAACLPYFVRKSTYNMKHWKDVYETSKQHAIKGKPLHLHTC
jgi:hypothetical protein